MDAATLNDLISGYALDDLDESEARDLEAVLARDPALRREAESVRQALETLALDAGAQAPPAGPAWSSHGGGRASQAPTANAVLAGA